jgi:hypothetical protein
MLWVASLWEEVVPLKKLPYFLTRAPSSRLTEVLRLRQHRTSTAGHPVLDVPCHVCKISCVDVFVLDGIIVRGITGGELFLWQGGEEGGGGACGKQKRLHIAEGLS